MSGEITSSIRLASYDEYQDYMSKALSWFANRTISELVDG